uniref:Apple domain-containing protein n=1 Tax=Plectus sambesii TaxID=2011161 RepID=A0A914UZK5_9BILA
RFEGKSIQGVPDNIVQGTVDVNQCQQECAGAITKYQIICKSILWSEQQKGCILVEVSAGDVPNQVVDDANIDYYEYLCGGNSATTTTPLPVTTPGFPITPSITQGPQPITGSGTGLRDPRISSCFQQLSTQSAMTEDRIFPVTSVDQCADTCLFCADCLMGQRCNMVAYAM